MKLRHLLLPALLLASLTSGTAFAGDRGDRVDRRMDRHGERVDHRLDQRGDRIDQRLDRLSTRADDRGHARTPRDHRSGATVYRIGSAAFLGSIFTPPV